MQLKASLIDMHHRLNMCQVRVMYSLCVTGMSPLSLGLIPVAAQTAVGDSSWLMVDAWEWTRTTLVLRELRCQTLLA